MSDETEPPPTFSARTAWRRDLGPFGVLAAAARHEGRELSDLTETNPTRCSLADTTAWVRALGDGRGTAYDPTPLGLLPARQAVARYYHRRQANVGADQVLLSASSSESYSWLFKLLCDPGDAILVPQPSYPLLPYLADLASVELVGYRLVRDEGWRMDLGDVERLVDRHERARALVAVHPANPTGSLVLPEEAAALDRLARDRGLAVIIDEVFLDYPHTRAAPAGHVTFAGAASEALRFVLSGLSKVALMPQAKLGWMVVGGPPDPVAEAMGRLELIADSYLSVATAVQWAAPTILDEVDPVQHAVRQRLTANLAGLDRAIAAQGADCPVRRLPTDGGWVSLVEVPRTRTDDEWAVRLVEQAAVLVQPGYLFDMAEPGSMVVSLLPEPAVFAPAIERAVACWAAG